MRAVKLLVWDLDHTLWDGILLEDFEVRLRPGAREVLEALDRRGILHSIASRNDHAAALERLRELGVADFFLYPQIHWGSKAAGIRRILEQVNLGADAVAFIDDQPFERDEVRFEIPEVLVLDAALLADLPRRPELTPRFVTDESALRRRMYQAEAARKRAEEEHDGPSEAFLASLGMRFQIAPAGWQDLQRAEELTVRTHQLNTTGYTYSYEELDALRRSPDHLLLVASLEDRYGTYGKVGLALVETAGPVWTLKLLLMSCRVMSRGVGTILLHHVLERARDAGARLRAELRPTGRNRPMLVTLAFCGFREVERRADGLVVFEGDPERIQGPPDYVDVRIVREAGAVVAPAAELTAV
jgi:FkbH-like protein